MYIQALLFTIFATAQAQRVSNGLCDFANLKQHPTPVAINASNLFEIKRIKNTWNNGQCASWQFISRGNSMFVTTQEVVDSKLIVRDGTTIESEDSFSITFKDFSADFTILVGSQQYAILYACKNQGNNKQEYAWLLGLNRNMSQTVRNAAESALKDNNLSDAVWEEISHTQPCSNHVAGAANIFKLSPFIVLIFGSVVSKVL